MSNSQDSFGFQTEYEYDRKKDYQSTPSNVKKENSIHDINRNISIILVD